MAHIWNALTFSFFRLYLLLIRIFLGKLYPLYEHFTPVYRSRHPMVMVMRDYLGSVYGCAMHCAMGFHPPCTAVRSLLNLKGELRSKFLKGL